MHFQPLAFDDKVTWYNNGGSNFQNLGSSTAISKAPQPTDVHEVVAACQTLELFASEYFSADLKSSITALVALVTGLARSHVWEVDDLPLLVYWINITLEEYRTQVSHATLVPGEFQKSFRWRTAACSTSCKLCLLDSFSVSATKLRKLVEPQSARQSSYTVTQRHKYEVGCADDERPREADSTARRDAAMSSVLISKRLSLHTYCPMFHRASSLRSGIASPATESSH